VILSVVANLLPEDASTLPMDGINKVVAAIPKKHLLHIDGVADHGWHRLKAALGRVRSHQDKNANEKGGEDNNNNWLVDYLIEQWQGLSTLKAGGASEGEMKETQRVDEVLHTQALGIARAFALLNHSQQREFLRVILAEIHKRISARTDVYV